MNNEGLSNKINETFNLLNKDNMHILDGFYSEQAIFQDPAITVNGLPQIKKYYQHVYENVQSIKFNFKSIQNDGFDFYGSWTMDLKVKNLNKGEVFSVDGISHIRFNDQNKVIYHRDYLDLGAMVYEKLPILGKIILAIKKRMHV